MQELDDVKNLLQMTLDETRAWCNEVESRCSASAEVAREPEPSAQQSVRDSQGQVANDPANPFLEPSDFIDPLADASGCARDLPFLQSLGVNAIRVYSVDSTKNHDACMAAFSGAGIYTMFVPLFIHSVSTRYPHTIL